MPLPDILEDRADDGLGVDAVVLVEVLQIPRLPKVGDPEAGVRGRPNRAEKAQGVRLAVGHAHDRQRMDRSVHVPDGRAVFVL